MLERRDTRDDDEQELEAKYDVPRGGRVLDVDGKDVPDAGADCERHGGPRHVLETLSHLGWESFDVRLFENRQDGQHHDLSTEPDRYGKDVKEDSDGVEVDVRLEHYRTFTLPRRYRKSAQLIFGASARTG